jgi:hypothetical protein
LRSSRPPARTSASSSSSGATITAAWRSSGEPSSSGSSRFVGSTLDVEVEVPLADHARRGNADSRSGPRSEGRPQRLLIRLRARNGRALGVRSSSSTGRQAAPQHWVLALGVRAHVARARRRGAERRAQVPGASRRHRGSARRSRRRQRLRVPTIRRARSSRRSRNEGDHRAVYARKRPGGTGVSSWRACAAAEERHRAPGGGSTLLAGRAGSQARAGTGWALRPVVFVLAKRRWIPHGPKRTEGAEH